ncbi:equilibrative nucleoside transporter 1-like [Tubulanus polymorphus]|uniref:equilibrative nucleoside transporter 1-like n=1 Tax=Tubulanus polymorphus TaxID=672921 RepID=UPI003DA4A3A7
MSDSKNHSMEEYPMIPPNSNYNNSKPIVVKSDGNGSAKNELMVDDEHQQPLLSPVHLDPGQEAADDASFNAPIGSPAPKDWCNLVYFIMMLNGIGVLMPWNMFITANDYFVKYKLNTNSSDSQEYKNNFISYLGITAQIPNVILNAVNMFAHCGGGNLTMRIVCSIIVMVLCFIVTIIFAMIDTSGWPGIFFGITMATVVVINMATGLYQNSVFGMAATLPMKYTNAVVVGTNISGTLTSIIAIVSTASSPNPRTAAIYYFLAAILILLIDFDTYFALPLLKFYKHYVNKQKAEQIKAVNEQSIQNVSGGCCAGGYCHRYSNVFKQTWVQQMNVFLTFFVTLVCFPALEVKIEASDPDFFIPPKYYTLVMCFLIFNSFAVLGNLITEFIRKPGPKYLIIVTILRLVFIPYFMLCNYKPDRRSFPVYLNNDYAYLVGGILMALSHGYCSSLSMMYAPKVAKPEVASTAGMMAAFFLVFGIFSGVNFSLFCSWLVENIGNYV